MYVLEPQVLLLILSAEPVFRYGQVDSHVDCFWNPLDTVHLILIPDNRAILRVTDCPIRSVKLKRANSKAKGGRLNFRKRDELFLRSRGSL